MKTLQTRTSRKQGQYHVTKFDLGSLDVQDGKLFLTSDDGTKQQLQLVRKEHHTEIHTVPQKIHTTFLREVYKKIARLQKETGFIKGEHYEEVEEIISESEFWRRIESSDDFLESVREKEHDKFSPEWEDGDTEIPYEEAWDLVLDSWKKDGVNEIDGSFLRKDGLVELSS